MPFMFEHRIPYEHSSGRGYIYSSFEGAQVHSLISENLYSTLTN
jgi:hypothetical protein